MKYIFAIIITILLVSLGCVRTHVIGEDIWLRPAPSHVATHILQSKKNNVLRVTPVAREGAVSRLESEPLVALSQVEAEVLVGQALEEGKYFLMRGLCAECANRSFNVYFDGKNILVYNRSLAQRGARLTRWPVVVGLEEAPEQVYIGYSFAQ